MFVRYVYDIFRLVFAGNQLFNEPKVILDGSPESTQAATCFLVKNILEKPELEVCLDGYGRVVSAFRIQVNLVNP